MTVYELMDQLVMLIKDGRGRCTVVMERMPTEQSGYLVTVAPVNGTYVQDTPKGPRVVVR